MRKASLFFSIASFVTSAVTLGVIAFGVRKIDRDIQDIRAKSNDSVQKLKDAVNNIQV